MPETEEFDDEFGAPEGDDQFKAMRARANKAARLERDNATLAAENQRLARNLAFTSAGLSLTEKQQAALLAAHGDTDLTADALLATAVELGFAQPAADPEQTQRDEALTAQTRIAAAQAGSTPPSAVPALAQQIATAEQAGDWRTAAQLKAQQVAVAARSAGTATFT